MKQTSSIGIDGISSVRIRVDSYCSAGFMLCLGVASGIVPYFAVAKMINLLIARRTGFFDLPDLWCSVALVAYHA